MTRNQWIVALSAALAVACSGDGGDSPPEPPSIVPTASTAATAETGLAPPECFDEVIEGPGTTTTSLLERADDYGPVCTDSSGPDVAFAFTPTTSGIYRFDTQGTPFDTVLTVFDDCDGDSLGCNDDVVGGGATTSELTLELRADETVIIVVDTPASTELGDGEVTLGVRRSVPETCDDGIDNDLDELADCYDRDCAADAYCCPAKPTHGPGRYPSSGLGLPDVYGPASCALPGDVSGSEVTYAFTAPNTAEYRFSADRSTSSTLSLLDGCGGNELACTTSLFPLTFPMTAGQTVLVVVDGANGSDVVFAELDIVEVGPEVCNDGIDNDGDFAVDCLDVEDCDSDPVCGPEICDDDFDNDNDLRADCHDPDCQDQAVCCPDESIPGPGSYTFDTTGRSPGGVSCESSLEAAPNVSIEFTPQVSGRYRFDTAGSAFNTAVGIERGCGGTSLACSDFSGQVSVDVELEAGVSYIVQVGGVFPFEFGVVQLEVTLQGSEICDDGVDNDQDFLVDCDDRSCGTDPACAEDCSNEVDDDGDGAVDCEDVFCGAEPACCPSVRANTVPFQLTGDFADGNNFQELTCAPSSPGNDVSIEFVAPEAGRYAVQTGASPSLLRVGLASRCGGPELGCSTLGPLSFELTEGERVLVIVEAVNAGSNGPFDFTIDRVAEIEADCDDLLDDDFDGRPDCFDSDCANDEACFELVCDDGVDSDGDFLTDCLDPDCTGDPSCIEICDNGADEDQDGDADCVDVDCESSPACVEVCTNGSDDDGDGRTDCSDGACAADPTCCPTGGSFDVVPLTVTGDLAAEPDVQVPACSGPAVGLSSGNDLTIEFVAPSAGDYVFTTGASDPTDVIVSLRDACDGVEIACDNTPLDSKILRSMAAGESVIVTADGYNQATGNGPFQLDIFELQATETDCDDGLDQDLDAAVDCADPDCAGLPSCVELACDDLVDNDLDGLFDCRDPDCAIDPLCAELDCTNGVDDDGDGSTDCTDPDCDVESSCFEDCANGTDDDLDGATDCDDGSCSASPQCCPSTTAVSAPFAVSGDFTAEPDLLVSTCTLLFSDNSFNDFTVEFRAPAAGDYLFSAGPRNAFFVASLFDTCGGTELDCAANLPLVRTMSAGETVLVAVEGSSSQQFTNFTLDIVPFTPTELECGNGVDDDRDFFVDCLDEDCVGGAVCTEFDCANDVDDDQDFARDCRDTDCDFDPACPETCDDGVDNDGDFLVDCQDGGCSGTDACCVTSGTLIDIGRASTRALILDQNTPSCALSDVQDASFEFTAPASGDYTFDTFGSDFDTVLTVLDGCGGAELACNDDTLGTQSEVTVTLSAGQTVLVVVDGFAASIGDVVVNVQ